MFVLTEHYNEYDQQGVYLVTVFDKKPEFEELKDVLMKYDGKLFRQSFDITTHILNGGGRINDEQNWFFLTELKSGQLYEHSNGKAEWI